jgi:ectoine hydroxylase-related dioxygenase (phytanoyl-CoA dioxygenase family)
MPVPPEFTPEAVKAHSAETVQLFTAFTRNHQLEESMFENNPWLRPPTDGESFERGTGRYWDTTVASRHPYWRSVDLPKPTKQIERMRADFLEWGYCLIEDGMSPQQCSLMRDRLWEQAAAERLAGVEQGSSYGQYVNTLVNKGDCFARAIEQDPAVVQAGPVLEQLIEEIIGAGWICHSFLANGADPGGKPQAIHIDQGGLLPWLPGEAPMLVNTMYIFEDVDDSNGGTVMIPGSHRVLAMAGTGGTVGALPPSINLDAKAGTIMLFDGRLLHGTGINRTRRQRFVATMGAIKSWMRQQENWILSVKPDVLATASPKLLHRMGFQAVFNGGTVEGFGINYATGAPGDPMGAILAFRQAQDAGSYRRVGELRPTSSREALETAFTLRDVMARATEKKR